MHNKKGKTYSQAQFVANRKREVSHNESLMSIACSVHLCIPNTEPSNYSANLQEHETWKQGTNQVSTFFKKTPL